MNIVLWIAQVLLAFGFLGTGYGHAFKADELQGQPRMEWMKALPRWLKTFIGISEMAGGVGVLLPALTGIQPWLTPLAAALLALVMLLAFVFHVVRREYPNLVVNAILFALAAFVAYGRWVLLPIGG